MQATIGIHELTHRFVHQKRMKIEQFSSGQWLPRSDEDFCQRVEQLFGICLSGYGSAEYLAETATDICFGLDLLLERNNTLHHMRKEIEKYANALRSIH